MFDQGMPPQNIADQRINMHFTISEIDNGYIIGFNDGKTRPTNVFFPWERAPNIPLYISQQFLHAMEERERG